MTYAEIQAAVAVAHGGAAWRAIGAAVAMYARVQGLSLRGVAGLRAVLLSGCPESFFREELKKNQVYGEIQVAEAWR